MSQAVDFVRCSPRGAVAALFVLTLIIRLPSLLHPGPIDDEGVYSVVANEIVDGGRAYVDAIERKPPLLFWTYAAVFAVAGKSAWLALHAVALCWTLLTMAGLLAIGQKLFDRQTGLIAALLYVVFHAWGTWKNLAFNGEMLMNLPLVWAWALALRPATGGTAWTLLAAGGLLSAASLLKQPAAIAAIPLALYVVLNDRRAGRLLQLTWGSAPHPGSVACGGPAPRAAPSQARRARLARYAAHRRRAQNSRGEPHNGLIDTAILSLGFVIPLVGVAAVLQAQGTLDEAIYWTVTNHDVPMIFWRAAAEHTAGFLVSCLPLVGAALTTPRSDAWRERTPERLAITGWLLVSCVGAAWAGRFYPHYYIQVLPPLVILAAPVLVRAGRDSRAATSWFTRSRLTPAWLILAAIVFGIAHWIGLAPSRADTGAGQYLRRHSSPDSRIFVWGQSARIYLDARRRPASRYITTFALTGHIFGPRRTGSDARPAGIETRDRIVPGAWRNLATDFERHPPEYIVDTEVTDAARYPVDSFPALANLLASHYQLVAKTTEADIYRRTGARSSMP